MDYITTSIEKWKLLKPLARENRNAMTLGEKYFWNIVRKNQLGVKFRRQQVISGYIADFVSLELKLIIEIDGTSHEENKEYDENRSKILNELGYKIIRFTNEEVVNNGNVVEKILIREINNLITGKES